MKTYTMKELENAMKRGGIVTLDIVSRLETGNTTFLNHYKLVAIHSQPVKFIAFRYNRMIDESCHVNANTAFDKQWREKNVFVPVSPEGAIIQISSFIKKEKKRIGFQNIRFLINLESVDIC